jgi:hypothetical protein
MPSHAPVRPQVLAACAAHCSAGSGWPAGTGPQVPALPDNAQDSHDPVHAVLQQTPSAQKPDWHSDVDEQAAPTGLRPHVPPLQTFPIAQFASAVQLAKQRVPLHAKGAQESGLGATQVPWPLQTAAAA